MTILNLSITINKDHWLTSNKRKYWAELYRAKRQIRTDAHIIALAAMRKAGVTLPVWTEERPCAVTVAVAIPTRHLFDPANAEPSVKAAIDGFTDAGMWTDDNRKVVKSVTYTSAKGRSTKGCYRLDFTISDSHEPFHAEKLTTGVIAADQIEHVQLTPKTGADHAR